ncbi:hypothetical protein K474DRAFT_1706686 [Panus rudis PR-1116 ss-1]|nr:hypothetical protein K474DRAFT_1706686 [Panus rudis PR-1116 ss-1]
MIGLWGLLTYPFARITALLRNASAHPARHAHNKGHMLPSRLGYEKRLPAIDALRNATPEESARREAEEEKKDALSPLYDQLTANWVWHILEYLPQRVKKQKAILEGTEKGGYKWMWNKGRGRKIFKDEVDEGLKVHRSVKTRLEAGEAFVEGVYIPKVRPNLPTTRTDEQEQKKKVKRDPVMLEHHQWNVDEPVHWTWVD